MKVKFLNNYPKNIDGAPVGPFVAGQEYDLPQAMADKFIRSSMCVDALAVVEGDGTGEALPEVVDGESNEHESE